MILAMEASVNGTANGSTNTDHEWMKRLLDSSEPMPKKSKKSIVIQSTGIFFAFIGVISSLRWIVSLLTTSSFKMANKMAECTTLARDCTGPNCPCGSVLGNLSERLAALEEAFKTKVLPERTNSSNGSDLLGTENGSLLLQKTLENITAHYQILEKKIHSLTLQIRIDEFFLFIFIILVSVEMYMKIRPRIEEWLRNKEELVLRKKADTFEKNEKIKNGTLTLPGTPKHKMKALKNELCIVIFGKENNNVYSLLVENMLKHYNDVKLASNPFLIVECMDHIRNIPPVKMYIVICDCEVSSAMSNGWDMYITVIKMLLKVTAHVVVIIGNEEGSKKLVAHSQYNTNLRLVNTYECMKDLASNGRVFSMWQDMTSHQMGHLRKILRNVLNARPSMGPLGSSR